MPLEGESPAELDFIHFSEAYGRRRKCFGRPMNMVRE
jgi:hypothetical protein